MLDSCLAAVAKSRGLLNLDKLIEFLEPWYGIAKYAKDILVCLQKNSPPSDASHPDHLDLPSKAKQKATLQALRHSKKQKNMDDPLVAEEAQMISLQDQWLIARGKATPEVKARVKKAAEAEKKLVEKQNKTREQARAKSQNQSLSIRMLALSNSRGAVEVGTFKDILSDPPTGDDPQPPDENSTPAQESPTAKTLRAANSSLLKKKKAKGKPAVDRLNASRRKSKEQRPPTPSPVAMKLIRPGKRRVRVPANAVGSTPTKRMRMRESID